MLIIDFKFGFPSSKERDFFFLYEDNKVAVELFGFVAGKMRRGSKVREPHYQFSHPSADGVCLGEEALS